MKEAMRCHPGVSFPLERVTPEGGLDVCGVHLDAGTIVAINPAVIHHDKSIFGEDAYDFNPERWLATDQEYIKRMDRHLMTVSLISSHALAPLCFCFLVLTKSWSSSVTARGHALERISLSWKWANSYHRYCGTSTSSGLLISLYGVLKRFGLQNSMA